MMCSASLHCFLRLLLMLAKLQVGFGAAWSVAKPRLQGFSHEATRAEEVFQILNLALTLRLGTVWILGSTLVEQSLLVVN